MIHHLLNPQEIGVFFLLLLQRQEHVMWQAELIFFINLISQLLKRQHREEGARASLFGSRCSQVPVQFCSAFH